MLKISGILIILCSVFLLYSCDKGPKYPNCSSDKQCASHNEFCVNKICKQCRDNSNCLAVNPCMFCADDSTCQKTSGCCTSSLDCPGASCEKDSISAVTGKCTMMKR